MKTKKKTTKTTTEKNYSDRYADVKAALNALARDTTVELRTTVDALNDIAQACTDLADELEEEQVDPRISADIQL